MLFMIITDSLSHRSHALAKKVIPSQTFHLWASLYKLYIYSSDTYLNGYMLYFHFFCLKITFNIYIFQFIVVSLKDGMFNNANVLFKTKFVDGVSTVTRYVQSQSSRTASTSSVSGTANKNKKTKRARIDENSALL